MKSSSSIFYYAFSALAAAATLADAAEPVTVVFQNGLNNYEGTYDRRISLKTETDGLFVTTGDFSVDGGASATGDADFSNVLIRFDGVETTIPAGAKILNAKITMVNKTGSNDQSGDAFSVYRLTRPFTFESSMKGDFGADGVKGDSDWLLGSFHGPNVAGQASVVSADVTRAVQSWVDGSPNLGVGITVDRGTNAWNFQSTGAANVAVRPKLEVTYLLDTDVRVKDYQQGLDGYAGCFDILLNGKGATGVIAGDSVLGSTVAEYFLDGFEPMPADNPDVPALIRFDGLDVDLAGRKIDSAKLKLVTGFSSGEADSGGPFTVHRLLVPFTEASKYGTGDFVGDAGALLAAGKITPAIASFTGMQDCEVVDADISEAVKAWAAGEPNYGLYIGSGTPNGWQIWTSGAHVMVQDPAFPGDATKKIRVEEVRFRPLVRVVSSPALPIEIVSPLPASRHVVGTPFNFQVNTATLASKVEFFLNGKSVAVDANSPYSYSFPADKLGNYVLTATMTRADSTTVNSEPVSFSVVPPAGTGGLYFNGVSDQVALGNPAELGLSTFTLETWFRREIPGTSANTGGVVAIPLIAKGRNQADNSSLDTNWFLGIRESDGVLCADFEGAGGVNVPVAGRTPVPSGQWQHAAATFDGSQWRLYLNGNLEAVVNDITLVPRADSLQHASIATAMNSNGLGEGAFGGFIDEARIWNVARSQVQIRQSINSEITSASGLVARWAMSEGSGTKITSTVTPNLVGNFGGAPLWTAGQAFNGNANPTISFVSPADGGAYLNNSPLTYTVSASDPDGSIVKVEYYDNGVLAGSSTTAPFSFTYTTPPVGIRRMTAVAIDNAGGSARTDNIITSFVNYTSPTIPGYTAGIIDGKDAELFTGTPAANPAPWTVVASTSTPNAFTGPGTVSGDIEVKVNGTALPYNAGVLLASNAVLNGNNAAIDNIVAPYEASGVYHVSSRDNNGPGETQPEVSPESSSFSLGWFPYAKGWTGANISAAGAVIGGSSSLPAGAKITRTGTGVYEVYGLPVTGNLIAVSIGNNADNCATTGLGGDNWIVTTRDNNGTSEDSDFAILYVPDTANRVLSGKIGNLAEFTALNQELELLGATSRSTVQGYEITFGDGSLINPSNTALFITADAQGGNGPDNIYSYSAAGNSFVVFSHDLPGLNTLLQTGGFRFLAVPLNPTTPGANEVSITATKATVAEDAAERTLNFKVTRSGNTTAALLVNYTVSGTATSGSDFTALPGTVTIPAGAASVEIAVPVLGDSVNEPDETLTLALAAGTGYTSGVASSGTGRILDAAALIQKTTVTFQEGLNGYTGQFQKLIGDDGTSRLGSANATYGVDGGLPDVNDLMRFDNIIGTGAGQIPLGAKVLKAELTLMTGAGTNDRTGGPFLVDRLTSPVNADTTYNSVNGGSGTLQGVRNISARTPVAGVGTVELNQPGILNVTDIVRAWAAGQPNYGFSIYDGGTSDAWTYGTVGNTSVAMRPKLVVTYTTQATREYTIAADRSALISSLPGSTTKDGSTLEGNIGAIIARTNNTQEALLRFPLVFDNSAPGAIPLDEEIVKAELLITTPTIASSQTANVINVHQMLEDWNVTSSYGINGPRTGVQIAGNPVPATGLGLRSTTWVDVTSIVRNWRAGVSNYGFNLKPTAGDDWIFYFPGAEADFAPRLRITTAGGNPPAGVPFDSWAASFGAGGIAVDSDNDQDGITALMEYALGLSPVASNALPGIVRTGNDLSLSFAKGTQAAGDSRVKYEIVSSPDLVTWVKETLAIETANAISLTVPSAGTKKFFRLKVDYTP